MKKGSKCRKCLVCRTIVGWAIPEEPKAKGFWGEVASKWVKPIKDTKPNVTLQIGSKQIVLCDKCFNVLTEKNESKIVRKGGYNEHYDNKNEFSDAQRI